MKLQIGAASASLPSLYKSVSLSPEYLNSSIWATTHPDQSGHSAFPLERSLTYCWKYKPSSPCGCTGTEWLVVTGQILLMYPHRIPRGCRPQIHVDWLGTHCHAPSNIHERMKRWSKFNNQDGNSITPLNLKFN